MTINKRLKKIVVAVGFIIGVISGLITINGHFKEDRPIINNYYINNQEYTNIHIE